MNTRPRLSLLTLALAALAAQPAPSLAQAPSQPAAGTHKAKKPGAAVKAQTPVTLNFVNADIEAVTRAIGVMMDKQFVIDPRVKGTITLYSEQPLSVHEAYLNYLAGLRGLGFTVVESGGLLKVLPEADAKLQSSAVILDNGAPRGDQILTQVYRLNYEQANNLVPVLRPLISPNNTVQANPGNNTLVVTDYADNLQRIAKIIAAMDTPASTDLEIIPLKHSVASDMAALVARLADGGGAAAAPNQPALSSGGSASVVADPRSNSLIVRAPNAAKLAAVRSIVAKLDVPGSDSTGNIRVVYLKNADATKLATVLRAAFGAGGSTSGGSGSTPGGSGLGSFGNSTAPSSPVNNPGQGMNSGTSGSGLSAAATQPVSSSPSPSTGGFVQADPSTNALIITAPEPLYRQIRNVIDQLDGRRAQVYVETLIVKVDASKTGAFGVQWQNLFGNKGDNTLPGLGTNFGTGAGNIIQGSAALYGGSASLASAVKDAPAGLNFGLLKKIGDKYTLGAIANFLETEAGANVLSTPNLVALDNEEAKIVVGRNVPFVTGSFTNTGSSSGTVNPFQTYDRKDVGITLRIRSQIGEGGTVRMTVYQENSSIDPTTKADTSGPATEKSAIETTVSVDDGEIIVLGGLLKDEFADSEGRVPGLGSIPLIGNLFKNTGRSRIKTNLMVFLRPVIMRDQKSADDLTLDRYEYIRGLQQSGQPQPKFALPDTGAPMLPGAEDKKPGRPMSGSKN
ncbi:type II secretion system secretin GspD [Mitsuaria sp. WAJ17]|uniref:type II secretion system secretin GspD n=1 Tax=Mitsuaria sp. WAJ17 TaxID=2761452 RepID=UPI0021056CD8|nr:type II secretion system secretin GspD [Mitsuaria sp. WAJ17]